VTNLKEKRRQLLNLTITEIILIMLFLSLLISYWAINKNKVLQRDLANYKSLDLNLAELGDVIKIQKAIADIKKDGNGEFPKTELSDIIKEGILAIDYKQKLKDKDTDLAQVTEDHDRVKKELNVYKERFGSGIGIPPCWNRTQETNSFKILPEYLYDVIIVNDGIILTNTNDRYPHRINDRKKLPLSQIVENIALSDTELMSQALEVFNLKKDTRVSF